MPFLIPLVSFAVGYILADNTMNRRPQPNPADVLRAASAGRG